MNSVSMQSIFALMVSFRWLKSTTTSLVGWTNMESILQPSHSQEITICFGYLYWKKRGQKLMALMSS